MFAEKCLSIGKKKSLIKTNFGQKSDDKKMNLVKKLKTEMSLKFWPTKDFGGKISGQKIYGSKNFEKKSLT